MVLWLYFALFEFTFTGCDFSGVLFGYGGSFPLIYLCTG